MEAYKVASFPPTPASLSDLLPHSTFFLNIYGKGMCDTEVTRQLSGVHSLLPMGFEDQI